jgi:hypothetical protein
MKPNESTSQPVPEQTMDARLAEEIQRALEIMRRARIAQAARAEEVEETPGNTFELPPWPFVFRVSNSSHQE